MPGLQKPGKKRGTKLQATIVVLLALVATLSVAEIGVRVVEKSGAFPWFFQMMGNAKPPLDKRTGPGMYYSHHYSAYALKPDYRRAGFERINNLGFRGEDIELQKPDDVYRIVAVGGSTTFAVYLPWQESYPYLLQQELRRRFGTDKIEVINAGLTGSTASESFHRLPTQVLPIDPDMVVIYHAFNDLLPRMFDNYQEDYYHFRRSDPNNPPGMTRFYLYRLALAVMSPGTFHENYNLSGQVWKLDNLPKTDTERVRNFVDSNNDAFRFNMENMIVLLEAKGIDVVLASFAINNFTWHWLDDLPPYMWKEGIDTNNEVIAELAEEHSVPLVPFTETPFVKASKRFKAKMFADSIHMGPEGNQLKAEIFADTLAPIIAKDLGVDVPEPSIYFAEMTAGR